jgi:hypothetical protein
MVRAVLCSTASYVFDTPDGDHTNVRLIPLLLGQVALRTIFQIEPSKQSDRTVAVDPPLSFVLDVCQA